MAPIRVDELNLQAKDLLRRAWGQHRRPYGFGSMSCAVYDTAWVSMVAKTSDGRKKWLFPDCFHFILETQAQDGGWKAAASAVDGILNTAASLLSLVKHAKEPLQLCAISNADLQSRIRAAFSSLQLQLSLWDVTSSLNVGFEIIVPALLRQLEDEGFTFEFGGRADLMRINAAKLRKFKPECLYGDMKTPLIHSLEALIGIIDFDRVAQHKVQGAMLASPASTAAFLMNISCWDDEAEHYLCHVLDISGNGGVPSAYPSTLFEYTWICSTLLKSRFKIEELSCHELDQMIHLVAEAFQQQNGVIGFAPQLDPDADDTAKGLLTLCMSHSIHRQHFELAPMIAKFEAGSHFRTYPSERNPSYSANCNVLLAIVEYPDISSYHEQIRKITRFLCDHWWNTDGLISDKWNTSHLYPSMLLAQALVSLLTLVGREAFVDLLPWELKSRVAITLFQCCVRLLLLQQKDGSWESSVEKTAYGIIALSEARRLRFFDNLEMKIESAMKAGTEFILSSSEEKRSSDYLWIEKVSYRSSFITDSYILAALKACTASTSLAKVGPCNGNNLSLRKQEQMYLQLFRATPLFSDVDEWRLRASFTEATLFQPLLRAIRLEIFPREGMTSDKYFDIIPFTWTACNNRKNTFVPTSILYKMMVISFLNFQVDEWMEAIAGAEDAHALSQLKEGINGLFENLQSARHSDGDSHLSRFIEHVLLDDGVSNASCWDRNNLERELQIFLHAHLVQFEDNIRFGAQEHPDTFKSPTRRYCDWVRTTSADHTSCPYSFYYLSCLISSSLYKGGQCFPTAAQKYFADALCRHLAIMCRMYNDLGSIARDKEERNVNSVNFPEFICTSLINDRDLCSTLDEKKKTLLRLAEYERGNLKEALRMLTTEASMTGTSTTIAKLENRKLAIWEMFVDVTDLYGQIYMVQDIASRT